MKDRDEYGRALFLLAEEEGLLDPVLEELKLFRAALEKEPAYVGLLDSPALPAEKRLALIDEVLAACVPYVKNTVKLLAEKHRVHRFFALCDTYFALYDEKMGNLEAEAITAVPMTEKQMEALREKLNQITGKHILLKNTVDPAILGGAILRYAGIQQDGSVKMRLDEVKKSLQNAVL